MAALQAPQAQPELRVLQVPVEEQQVQLDQLVLKDIPVPQALREIQEQPELMALQVLQALVLQEPRVLRVSAAAPRALPAQRGSPE